MPRTTLDKPKKSALSIRLTESAVFLRTDGPSSRPHRNAETRSSLVRGLLVLELAKPTKIESVELELTATASTSWPDGVGTRRVEISEAHQVFHASTVYFKAESSANGARRAASIGPGTLLTPDDPTLDWDLDELDPSTGTTLRSPIDQVSTTTGGVALTHSNSVTSQSNGRDQIPPRRERRRVSVDSHYFQRTPVSHQVREDVPIPPYSPIDPAEQSPPLPAQSLEEYRAELQTSMRSSSRASVPSIRSHLERSLSRRPSIYDVPEDAQAHPPLTTLTPRASSPSPTATASTPSLASDERPSARSNPSLPSDSVPERQSSTSMERTSRGRNRSRFSFTAVADAFREAVRSTSPLRHRMSKASVSRERSMDDFRSRGRTMERSIPISPPPDAPVAPREPTLYSLPGDHRTTPRNREPFAAIFSTASDVKDKRDLGNGWKEFKAGTYTYPISFSVPATAPPTLHCGFGAVTWKLNAHVHRPGAFKSKYTAMREVQVIACPTEEDTEDTENIIVERHWDQQLQYLISVSGRSFHVGGVMPVTFAFMPLAKVKIHRLSVFIEERVDYYANMRRIARSDPVSRFLLLSAKYEGKHPPHLLPLDSNEPDALRKSPLYALINPEDDESQVASELMGPGPWSFHHELKLPASCNEMHFTNKNRRANMTVSHMLKVVIRVERGDDAFVDPKSGKRKLFDIVVQTPVHILSCRCNPDWISLPKYEESFNRGTDYVLPNCPCQVKKLVEAHGGSMPTPSSSSHQPTTPSSSSHQPTTPSTGVRSNLSPSIGSSSQKLSEHHPFHIPAPLERMISHLSTDSSSEDASTSHSLSRSVKSPQSPNGRSAQCRDPSHSHQRDSSNAPQHTPRCVSEPIVHNVPAHETSPIDPSLMRSLRLLADQNPQNAQMVRASRQFGRLVAGFESEFGEAPPAYDSVARTGRTAEVAQAGPSRRSPSSNSPAAIVVN